MECMPSSNVPVFVTVPALMAKWSVEQLPALVSVSLSVVILKVHSLSLPLLLIPPCFHLFLFVSFLSVMCICVCLSGLWLEQLDPMEHL